MDSLKVAALELPHRFGQVPLQLQLLEQRLSQLKGADLALLPEAALTGYVSDEGSYDLRPFAETLAGPTAVHLSALARKHQLALAAPLIEQAGENFFNAFLVFDREGRQISHYRKRHPWYPERWAAPGDLGTPVFELAGTKLALAICFDVHFLEEEAAAELERADILLFPSAWVEEEGDQRDVLLPRLARRFKLSIVNANWGAGVPRINGQGASRIVDPSGREVFRVERTPL